jgi:hypothetical protein
MPKTLLYSLLLGMWTASMVRVSGYRSRGPGSISGATRFLRSSGSGTGSTQPREYNSGAT